MRKIIALAIMTVLAIMLLAGCDPAGKAGMDGAGLVDETSPIGDATTQPSPPGTSGDETGAFVDSAGIQDEEDDISLGELI